LGVRVPPALRSTTDSLDFEEGSIVTETRAQRSPSEGRPSDRGRTGLGLFLRQVIAELRKVIWPTRDQLTTYFIVVLVFVLFMIAFVSVLDFGFNKAAFAIFG
jgi:preprotein translocase subunit SecE